MRMIGTILRIGLGVTVSGAALVAAGSLGATGHAQAANGMTIFAAVLAGALLNIPANLLTSTMHMAADGLEARLEAIAQTDRLDANEDVKRAGRRAAVRGVKVAVNRYYRSATTDVFDHDIEWARQFRRIALRWGDQQIKATRRKDRPATGGWNQPGLCYEGVTHHESSDEAIKNTEYAAWAEFTSAMTEAGVNVPERFDKFFEGAENCGPGWRRAGHLLFMRELKDNHDAFVGFVVDYILSHRIGGASGIRPVRVRSSTPVPKSPNDGARPPLKLKRPPRPRQPQA